MKSFREPSLVVYGIASDVVERDGYCFKQNAHAPLIARGGVGSRALSRLQKLSRVCEPECAKVVSFPALSR